jgi:hypothetical protein
MNYLLVARLTIDVASEATEIQKPVDSMLLALTVV